jgi:hypothetical protein
VHEIACVVARANKNGCPATRAEIASCTSRPVFSPGPYMKNRRAQASEIGVVAAQLSAMRRKESFATP